MELIAGYKGKAHVTSTQFRNIMQSIVGTESYIANLGEQLAPELVSNNSIKIRPGVLFHHGGVYEVADGTYDEIAIVNGTQGMKRIDLVVARYTKNSDTGVEDGEWVVIQGTPVASSPAVPAYTAGNMQEGDLVDDCPMYEVELDGINVTEVRTLVSVMKNDLNGEDFAYATMASGYSEGADNNVKLKVIRFGAFCMLSGRIAFLQASEVGSTIATIPSEYAPPMHHRFQLAVYGGETITIGVDADGTIKLLNKSITDGGGTTYGTAWWVCKDYI